MVMASDDGRNSVQAFRYRITDDHSPPTIYLLPEMGAFEDAVSDLVIRTYESLPSKCKPRLRTDGAREWTILCGIVLSKGIQYYHHHMLSLNGTVHKLITIARKQVATSSNVSL